MKLKHSYLKQFKHDWACQELVIGVLQNRRKAENAKERNQAAPKGQSKPKSKRKGFKARAASDSVPPEETEAVNTDDGESAEAGSGSQ